jgi:hypothetical protein
MNSASPDLAMLLALSTGASMADLDIKFPSLQASSVHPCQLLYAQDVLRFSAASHWSE